MRAGSGTAGIIILALTVGVTAADAQSVARSSAHSAARGDDAVAPRVAVPGASRLPGALAAESRTAQVELEYGSAQAYREEEKDDKRGFWPTFFGLPGSEASSHRGGGLAATRIVGWQRHFLPGLDLLQRALPASAAARIPAAARLHLAGDVADDDGSPFHDAIGAGKRGHGAADVPHGHEVRVLHANAHASFMRDEALDLSGPNVPGRTETAADFDFSLGTTDRVDGTSAASLPVALAAVDVGAAAVTVTPEPASLVLLGTGVAAWGLMARRRRTH